MYLYAMHIIMARALHESPFRFLEGGDLLGLVLDRADLLEHDALLCVALVCRPFRDQIFAASAPLFSAGKIPKSHFPYINFEY